jgi:hypothetical protein
MKHLLIVSLLLLSGFVRSQNASVRGFIYNQKNGEPVIFINVYLKGTAFGAATDVNGFYSITKVPPGDYTLIFRSPGYDSLSVPVSLKAGQILSRNLNVTERTVNLRAFEVSGQKEEDRNRVNISTTTITPKDMTKLPGIGADPDIAQYLQVLPGVTFTGDQGGQLYIRGGSPIQNKVLLDGIIIYNPFHSIGLFSVFDTDIIRNADVFTGGFGAEYGGRISSIMKITTRDGNKSGFGGKISVSPFVSKIQLEGPLLKRKSDSGGSSSFILSGRSSYLKQSSGVFYPYLDTAGLPYNFADLYGKISFAADNGSKLNISGFNFTDKVRYKSLQDLSWNTYGLGSSFVLIPSGSSVLFDGVFSYSSYNIKLDEASRPSRSSSISGFNLGLNFKYFLGKNDIQYGFEAIGFNTNFLFFNELNRKIVQEDFNTELAGYVKYHGVWGNLVFEPSFRAHYYASVGEFSPEPRLGLKYNLTETFRLKFAGGLYAQNLIAGVSDRDVVNLFYGFLSTPESLPSNFQGQTLNSRLQKARHLIAGFESDLTEHLRLNAEAYYFDFNQLTNINRNKLYDDNQLNLNKPDLLKKDFIAERGNSRGVDILLKYELKRLYVWAVYSLMQVTREDEVQRYSPVWDRRHNVNLVLNWVFGKNRQWEAGARWNYGSGFPFTQTQGFYEQLNLGNNLNQDYTTANGNLGILYGKLNGGRLPAFHRLDLSLRRIVEMKRNMRLEITAGITNAYNRENVFYFDRVKFDRVNQLPILPSIGANFKF